MDKDLLHLVYRASRTCLIGTALVLVPFLMYAVWTDQVQHAEPFSRTFYDVKFRISGSAKSPPTIVLLSSGKRVFFSDCNAVKAQLCDDVEYWSKWHAAKQVDVIETAPKRGIIRSILLDTGERIHIELNDVDASDKTVDASRIAWRSVHGLFVLLVIFTAILIATRYLHARLSEGK